MRDLREIKSRYEFQLDNRQLVLIFAGMVLILILVFILGILFGRSYSSPEAITLAATTGAEAPSAEAIVKEENLQPDAEEQKEREELIQKLEAEKVPTSIPPSTEPEPQGSGGPQVAGEPDKTPTLEPESGGKPAPASAEKPELSIKKETPPALPASTSGPYTIQIASFQNKADAHALVNKLKQGKYDAYILEADLESKGLWYRVRVGHYPDRELADKALKIIQAREKAYKDAYITH